MRTQNERLKEMMASMWVTPADAMQFAGSLRLAARVAEIRRSGVEIVDRWERLPNGKRVKAYRVKLAVVTAH